MTRNHRHGKKILKDLVKYLNEGTEDSRAMWAILTALRGPDEQHDQVKMSTTARIRGAIGIVGTAVGAAVSYNPPPPFILQSEGGSLLSLGRIVGWHFSNHYHRAVLALERFDLLKEDK